MSAKIIFYTGIAAILIVVVLVLFGIHRNNADKNIIINIFKEEIIKENINPNKIGKYRIIYNADKIIIEGYYKAPKGYFSGGGGYRVILDNKTKKVISKIFI